LAPKLHHYKITPFYFRHNELKSKILEINQNEQNTSPKSREADSESRLWLLVKAAGIFVLLFGFVAIITWYLSTPALIRDYLNWMSMQFDTVLAFLLVVMGVFLVLLVGLAFNILQKSKSLRKNLEDETGRRKEVEKHLARAQEMSKTGNWALELPGRTMQWSNEIYQILDCRPENTALTFQKFLKSVHPDDRGFVKKEIQKTLTQGVGFNLTHRIVCGEGSIKIVKQRSEVYLDSKGRPTQILGTLQDITGQKEAENLAARLGRILDRSFNEIYTFDAKTLKFTKVNLAARLNLRYTMEELREMTFKDLLPEFAWDQVEKLIASLKRGVESVTAFEAIHERKDRTTYPVDIRLQLSRTESRPEFVAIVQDISDRKKVEHLFSRAYQELDRRVEERTLDLKKLHKDLRIEIDEHKKAVEVLNTRGRRLAGIMNNVVDGIISIDEEGIIHSFNRAAEHLFGFRMEEILGQNINILRVGPDNAQRGEYFKNLLQSKKSATLGLRRLITARKKNGAVFSAELAVSETVIENQPMFTGLVRDLTEKIKKEQESMQILKPMTKL
jgi:PAS domain S-box-containing protein